MGILYNHTKIIIFSPPRQNVIDELNPKRSNCRTKNEDYKILFYEIQVYGLLKKGKLKNIERLSSKTIPSYQLQG